METPSFKIITLGSYSVGKTCILLRSTEPSAPLPSNYMCTIGVDFKLKMHFYNGASARLQIWDTAGQERFQHINKTYYKGSQGVILVFDITNKASFDRIPELLEDYKNCEPVSQAFVLVGNKSDRKDRQVSFEEGNNLANSLKIPYIECSALTGENIDKIFDLLVERITKTETPVNRHTLTPKFSSKVVNKRCC